MADIVIPKQGVSAAVRAKIAAGIPLHMAVATTPSRPTLIGPKGS